MIVLSAHGLSVQTADHTSLGEISYETDIATAATQLAAATGEQPVVTALPARGGCDARNTYDWGGLNFYTVTYAGGPEKYFVLVSSGKTATGLDLVAPNDQRIGVKLSDVLANVPGALQANTGVMLDVQNDPKYGPWGVVLKSEGGGPIVAYFSAPDYGHAHGICD